jgi:hypothetical protein
MAAKLWDLSEPQERVAVAMWQAEAVRIGPPSVARCRTRETFRDESNDTRHLWLERAAVAIDALLSPAKIDEGVDSDVAAGV